MASTAEIIERFGGQSALARLIGKGPSTVQYWAKTGRIPAKWQTTLLELAQAQGVGLEPHELGPQLPETSESVERMPVALWGGVLPIGENGIPVYVLDDGRRLIS